MSMNNYTENYTAGFSAGYAQKTDWASYDEVVASQDSLTRDAWLDGFNSAQDCAHPQYYEEV